MSMSDPTEHAVANRHADTVAVVTGSTWGIGEGVARRFAAEGASVLVTGRSADSGRAVVDDIGSAGGDTTFVRADKREPAEIATRSGGSGTRRRGRARRVLASDDASFITGESVLIDGGRSQVMQDDLYLDYRRVIDRRSGPSRRALDEGLTSSRSDRRRRAVDESQNRPRSPIGPYLNDTSLCDISKVTGRDSSVLIGARIGLRPESDRSRYGRRDAVTRDGG